MAFVTTPQNPTPEGAREHWLERDGLRFRAMTAPALGLARGSVFICPGRTEFIEKYFETVRDLQSRGFSVGTIDWRGQGLSDRETSRRERGHLNSFDDPVDDLAATIEALEPLLPRPRIFIAHSMGGGILLRALQLRKVAADGVLFSAPMWGIKALNAPLRSVARTLTGLRLGQRFAPAVAQRWRPENPHANVLTHDLERLARWQSVAEAEPRLRLAGPTLGWLAAAARVFRGFDEPGALTHVRSPMTIFIAGQERLVDNERIRAVAERLPQAEVVVALGARHEILMELDKHRNAFLAAFDAMAERVAPRRG